MRAFLGYRSVVDHPHGFAAPDEPIRLDKQFELNRRCIPDPGRNEVVQLIVFAKRKPLRHRLNALAIAGTDQPRHVEWTHLSPRLVTQPSQQRLEKASKLLLPIRRPADHGRPLPKPTAAKQPHPEAVVLDLVQPQRAGGRALGSLVGPMHPAQEPPPRMSGASRPGAKRPRFRLPARGASRVQPLSQVSHVSHAWDRQDGTAALALIN